MVRGLAGPEDAVLVVAAHEHRPRASHDVEHADGIGAPREDVADEYEPVARLEADLAEQRLELVGAAMDVSDDDCSTHAAEIVAGAGGSERAPTGWRAARATLRRGPLRAWRAWG